MWKEIIDLFTKDSLLEEAYTRSFKMLEHTGEMFSKAKRCLRELAIKENIEEIHKMDIAINKYQREVRRKVYKHLTVSRKDIYSSLVLVNIIIDIERIGDYTKNIADLAKHHPKKLEGGRYSDDLTLIEQSISQSFQDVINILKTSEADRARSHLLETVTINDLCKKHEWDYVQNGKTDESISDAVSYALYFRYLKRIHSHLRNIATTVVNSYDQIGFTYALESDKNE